MIIPGVYYGEFVKSKNGDHKSVFECSEVPAEGSMVYGFLSENNFHVLGVFGEELTTYINPSEKLTLNGKDDSIDGDKIVRNGDMIAGMLQNFIIAKASELAQVLLFREENLARIIGDNLQVFTKAFSLESFGTDMLMKMFGDSLTTDSVKVFGSKEGDMIHLFVQDVETMDCVAEMYIGSDGKMSYTTTREITIRKKQHINNPILKETETKTVSSKETFEQDPDNNEGFNLTDSKNNDVNEHNSLVNIQNSGWRLKKLEQETEEDAFFTIRDDGSIISKSSGGSFMELTSSGKIRLSAPNGVQIDSGGDTVILSKNIDIRSKGDIGITTDEGDLKIYANNEIGIKANIIRTEADSLNEMKSKDAIEIYAKNFIRAFGSEAEYMGKSTTVGSTLPLGLTLAGVDISNGFQYVTNPPTVTITSVPSLSPSAAKQALLDKTAFTFDNEGRLKNRTLYRARWMSSIEDTWNFGAIRINETVPYPGDGSNTKGYDDERGEFDDQSWKT